MFMCCSRASERCSSRPPGVTFKTTGRSAREGFAQEDPSCRALAEFGQETEANQDLPDSRKVDSERGGIQEAPAIEQDRQLVSPLREPPDNLCEVHWQPRLLAKCHLLVDQPDRRFVAEIGMTCQNFLCQRSFAPCQAATIASTCWVAIEPDVSKLRTASTDRAAPGLARISLESGG